MKMYGNISKLFVGGREMRHASQLKVTAKIGFYKNNMNEI